jgi:hypothetical protein
MIRQIIEFLPDDMDWNSWNGNMLHYFSEEPMPMVDELHWQELGRSLTFLPTFNSYAIPDPDLYDDWKKWAKDLTEVVNGPTN